MKLQDFIIHEKLQPRLWIAGKLDNLENQGFSDAREKSGEWRICAQILCCFNVCIFLY